MNPKLKFNVASSAAAAQATSARASFAYMQLMGFMPIYRHAI